MTIAMLLRNTLEGGRDAGVRGVGRPPCRGESHACDRRTAMDLSKLRDAES